MYVLIAIIIMWVIGIIGIAVMKKIEPDNKIYPIWVLFIVVAFTVFAIFYAYL